MDKVPQFYASDRRAWRLWLEKNHDRESAIWLVFDKGKNRTMTWQDIVKEALCFGWIDSRPGKVSDDQSKIYVSKRKPLSVWSSINKLNIAKLIDSGQMTPSGIASVEIAKRNGSWQALDLSDNLVQPPELMNAFVSSPLAKKNFEAFPVGVQKNILQWIYDAKTDVTRAKRIQLTVDSACKNTRLR